MRQPFTLSVGIMSNSAFASSALSKPPFQISPHRQMQIPAVREMQMGMKYDIVGGCEWGGVVGYELWEKETLMINQYSHI